MDVLKNLVADAVEEIRGVFSRNRKSVPQTCAVETDGYRNFAPVTPHDAVPGVRGDAADDMTLALRSSNEEPRSGGGGLLPGTTLSGPGTHPSRPGPNQEADVFIETDTAQGILGDVGWDVPAGGDAAVRILGDDGQLIDRGRG